MVYHEASLLGELLQTRLNLLAVNEGAVGTSQVPDLQGSEIDVQLAMMTRNEIVPFRARQLDEAIQGPSHLTPIQSAKAKPAVLMRPRKHRKPDGGDHRQTSPR